MHNSFHFLARILSWHFAKLSTVYHLFKIRLFYLLFGGPLEAKMKKKSKNQSMMTHNVPKKYLLGGAAK